MRHFEGYRDGCFASSLPKQYDKLWEILQILVKYVRNLTCRPRDNLTFRKELERQCHIQILILLVAAFTVGCLLMITVRAINKYWCSLRRRRVSRPISPKMVK